MRTAAASDCLRHVLLIVLTAMAGLPAVIAQVPDAGQLLRQEQDAAARHEQPTAPWESAALGSVYQLAPAQSAPAPSVRVRVVDFEISDDAGGLFPQASLRALIDDYLEQELSLAELERAADVLTQHYRGQGYFLARAYLPQQEVSGGVVAIHIAVGRIESGVRGEGILIRPDKLRLSEKAIRGTLSRSVRDGAPLSIEALEQGMLLLNELPGVSAKASLAAGGEPGGARLEIDAGEGRLLSAAFGTDNYGYRHTGAERLSTHVGLNDPLGIGDAASLSLVTTGSGLSYGQLSYQAPIGYRGLRAGLAYSHLQYELGEELESLDATGRARTASVFASYPLMRSRTHRLSARVALDYRALYNETLDTATSDKMARSATLEINDDLWDDLLGGGVTSLGLSATYGELDLDDSPLDALVDRLTAKTQGSYAKLNLTLSRQQQLGAGFSAQASASVQAASSNLDSSEKLTLGGAFGVRAYPAGEASGDEGYIANVELRWQTPLPLFDSTLRVFGFYDTGKIRLHDELWNGWRGQCTRACSAYSLNGAGLGLMWAKANRFALRASYARKIGDNPGRTVRGADSDGTDKRGRFWIQASVSL